MPIAAKFTRRQTLAGLAAATSLPLPALGLAAENRMRGALMILSTPYSASGEVDYEDLAREVDFCDRCGVQGLVWPQNSSEQRYLSREERLRGFEVLAEANRSRDMVLVLGVQADDTAGMLEGNRRDRVPLRSAQALPAGVVARARKAPRSLRRRNSRKRKFAIAAPPAGRLRRILVDMQRNRAVGGVDESGFAAVNSYDAGS